MSATHRHLIICVPLTVSRKWNVSYRCMDEDRVALLHGRIAVGLKENRNPDTGRKRNGTMDIYVKQNKPDSEGKYYGFFSSHEDHVCVWGKRGEGIRKTMRGGRKLHSQEESSHL